MPKVANQCGHRVGSTEPRMVSPPTGLLLATYNNMILLNVGLVLVCNTHTHGGAATRLILRPGIFLLLLLLLLLFLSWMLADLSIGVRAVEGAARARR